MQHSASTGYALLALRLSLALFMLMWAVFKVTTPASYGSSDGGAGIFGSFYGVSLGQSVVYAVGLAQIVFLLAFAVGIAKFITTGGVMLMNLATLAVSLPSISTSLGGDGNLLFAASFPVFGASLALFLMRDHDTVLSYGRPGSTGG